MISTQTLQMPTHLDSLFIDLSSTKALSGRVQDGAHEKIERVRLTLVPRKQRHDSGQGAVAEDEIGAVAHEGYMHQYFECGDVRAGEDPKEVGHAHLARGAIKS